MHHDVIIGNSRKMAESKGSVDLVVTSPPYWQLKDYQHEGQIGRNDTFPEYIEKLIEVFSLCYLGLKPGCRMVVNIGDQYLSASEHGTYRILPIQAHLIVRLSSFGFDYLGSIIWHKISTTQTSGGGVWMGSIYYPKDGHITYEHEYILLFRKPGKWPTPNAEQKTRSRLSKAERSGWFRGVWNIPGVRQKDHPAQFPLEVPIRLIKMYSFQGETVLDPFLGSGTTSLAAGLLGRNSVGYEVNPDYLPVIETKLQGLPDDDSLAIQTLS